MNDTVLKIYHSLPGYLRSGVASLRGYYLRSWRYGPETDRIVEEALGRESWSPNQWRAWQEERLAYILHSATTPKPTRVTVRNTVLHHCGLQKASSAALLLSGGDGHTAYNNILYGNVCHGITASIGAANVKIYNNTVYGGSQTGIFIQSTATSTDVRNNIAYRNAKGEVANQGTGTILAYNLTTDPRFRNPDAFDFNLQTSSPAINAGITLSLVTTDIKKTPRPQAAAYDIGAYEGDGTSASLSPPKNLRVE